MQLKAWHPLPELTNYKGPVDPMLLYPRAGVEFEGDSLLGEAWVKINQWQLIDGIDILESLKDSNSDRLLDILRLQGEVYWTRDHHEEAWMIFDQILREDSQDIQALIITATLSFQYGADDIYQERMDQLNKTAPEIGKQLESYLHLIEENHARTDWERDLLDIKQVDFIIVYGYGLLGDGSIPILLELRLQKGIELADKFPQAQVIVSGGAVTTPFNESHQMAIYLEDEGLDSSRIIKEPLARDTVGNSLMSTDIMLSQGSGDKNVVVVTSLGHLPRSVLSLQAALQFKQVAEGSVQVFGASFEQPDAYEVPETELAMAYTTTLRALGVFQGHLGQIKFR